MNEIQWTLNTLEIAESEALMAANEAYDDYLDKSLGYRLAKKHREDYQLEHGL